MNNLRICYRGHFIFRARNLLAARNQRSLGNILKHGLVIENTMPEFKVVVSDPNTGRSEKIEVKGNTALQLLGRKIGDIIPGEIVGKKGVKLKITGGSGRAGEPMLSFLPGGVKRYLLLSRPPGFHPREGGERRRKFVRGNIITEEIVQVNMVIVRGKNERAEATSTTS